MDAWTALPLLPPVPVTRPARIDAARSARSFVPFRVSRRPPQVVYPAGMLGTRTEIIVATLRDLLAAGGVTWDLDGPSQPHDILRGMTDELHDLEEATWGEAAGGPSPVIGRWLLVAIAADLQAETGLRLVLPR